MTLRGVGAPASLGVDRSDHLNYWANGFPALMITDTAFLRNPNSGVHEAVWALAKND